MVSYRIGTNVCTSRWRCLKYLIVFFFLGLALLASVFPDDKERAQANAIAFAGLSLGMISKTFTSNIL